MLAAAAIILMVDRPLRPLRPMSPRPPRRGTEHRACDPTGGQGRARCRAPRLPHRSPDTLGSSACTAVIAFAMSIRGRHAIISPEHAFTEPNRALSQSERDRDRLHHANTELEQRLPELRVLRVAAAQWLNLIDERTRGRLRAPWSSMLAAVCERSPRSTATIGLSRSGSRAPVRHGSRPDLVFTPSNPSRQCVCSSLTG